MTVEDDTENEEDRYYLFYINLIIISTSLLIGILSFVFLTDPLRSIIFASCFSIFFTCVNLFLLFFFKLRSIIAGIILIVVGVLLLVDGLILVPTLEVIAYIIGSFAMILVGFLHVFARIKFIRENKK